MTRILFWIALIVLVVMAVRSKLKAAARRSQMAPPPQQPSAPAGEIEAMTQCAHCGMYFPASEAVRADGLDYCSPGHVRLPPQ
ncbi:PP0621 family protein [Massilia niastensis]|uniref:PP0621 family protein n=1 Tax=Massilia niastensis TaxID=544911 RepID=UPI00035CFDDF|nr:PP0621 family protein [Massilia niastensis]